MESNDNLMLQGREAMRDKEGKVIMATLVYLLLTVGLQQGIKLMGGRTGELIGIPISFLIAGPLTYGLCRYFLLVSRNEEFSLADLFAGFGKLSDTFVTYWLVFFHVILRMLLLVIPGIIESIALSQTFYILNDDDTINPAEAIELSRKMMDGHKLRYFYLGCRFIGWILLGLITLGIGLLYVIPWMHTTFAKFYDDLKAYHAADETINPLPTI